MASKPYNMVDLESGYAEYLKQYKDTNDGISYWESLLMAPTKQYESSLKQATATRDYDISGAYANWKQKQLKLMQSSRLGTGVKSEIGSSLQSAYENQYAQAQQQYLTNVYSAYSDYLKGVNTAEEEIQAKAQQLANVTPMALQYYAEKHGLDYSDFNKAFYSKENQGYGIYDYNSETGSYSLSDYGKQVFDEVFNRYVTSPNAKTGELEYGFADWLAQQEGYEEAAKLYKSNPKLFTSAIGGKRAADLDYSRKDEIEDYIKTKMQSSKYYTSKYTFDSDESAYEFYTGIENTYKTTAGLLGFELKVPQELTDYLDKSIKDKTYYTNSQFKGIKKEGKTYRLYTDSGKMSTQLLRDLQYEYYKKTGKLLDFKENRGVLTATVK